MAQRQQRGLKPASVDPDIRLGLGFLAAARRRAIAATARQAVRRAIAGRGPGAGCPV
jgi:hypothetical protein